MVIARDLSATQRYMHLSPAATDDGIRLLEGRSDHGPAEAGHYRCERGDRVEKVGDILDTRSGNSRS